MNLDARDMPPERGRGITRLPRGSGRQGISVRHHVQSDNIRGRGRGVRASRRARGVSRGGSRGDSRGGSRGMVPQGQYIGIEDAIVSDDEDDENIPRLTRIDIDQFYDEICDNYEVEEDLAENETTGEASAAQNQSQTRGVPTHGATDFESFQFSKIEELIVGQKSKAFSFINFDKVKADFDRKGITNPSEGDFVELFIDNTVIDVLLEYTN